MKWLLLLMCVLINVCDIMILVMILLLYCDDNDMMCVCLLVMTNDIRNDIDY